MDVQGSRVHLHDGPEQHDTDRPRHLGALPDELPDGTPPAGIGTFIGPIQAYTFVVPNAEFTNGQNAIYAEEAYYAFGDGANNPVQWSGNSEWNVPQQFFLRPATKSTLVSTAFNIGLTPAQMTLAEADGGTADGRQLLASSDDVVAAVVGSTSAQAIGILGSEVYDSYSGRATTINELAFAGFGQATAYLPDSTTTAFDKQNLRNGNYTLWSPAVLIAPSSGTPPVPTNATVAYFVDVFLGNPGATPPNGFVDGGAPIDGLGATALAGSPRTAPCRSSAARRPAGVAVHPGGAVHLLLPEQELPGVSDLPASCTTCTRQQCTGTRRHRLLQRLLRDQPAALGHLRRRTTRRDVPWRRRRSDASIRRRCGRRHVLTRSPGDVRRHRARPRSRQLRLLLPRIRSSSVRSWRGRPRRSRS